MTGLHSQVNLDQSEPERVQAWSGLAAYLQRWQSVELASCSGFRSSSKVHINL